MLRPLVACAWFAAVAAEPGAVVVDRIVAVVGERLVLQSDVQLESVLAPLETSTVSTMAGPGTDPMQVVIDRAILRGLAGNAAIYVPSDGEVDTRAAILRQHFEDDTAWRQFLQVNGLDGERLASLLYSRLVVDRYVQRNLSRVDGQSEQAAYADWIRVHRARTPIRRVPTIEKMGSGR